MSEGGEEETAQLLKTYVQILAPPGASRVTLDKLRNLSMLHFPQLWNVQENLSLIARSFVFF